MTAAYIIIIVLFAVAAGADILLRHVWGIKRFGFEKSFFEFHGKTIPIEDFLPNNLSLILIYGLATGVFGAVYYGLGMYWALSLFFGLLSGLWVNFVLVHWIYPQRERLRKNTMPENYLQSGMDAVCASAIEGDSYGEIVVWYKNKNYRFPALSANGTDISKGEKVILVHNEQEVWWVEKDSEVFVGINGDDADST